MGSKRGKFQKMQSFALQNCLINGSEFTQRGKISGFEKNFGKFQKMQSPLEDCECWGQRSNF